LNKRVNKGYRIVHSELLDKVHAKVRELVQCPPVVTMGFQRPSARPHRGAWIDLEKLLLVSLLHHCQSLHLVNKFIEIKVPNLKSSGGVFQYGSGLKNAAATDDSYFFIEQLKLIGNQVNDLLMWLMHRVHGEDAAQHIMRSVFEVTQRMIAARVEKKKADDELER